MARSTEYPDLPFVEPASWTNANRSNVQLIVIHTTEGSSHSNSAEDGAAYDARRTDGTSTHYFHDSNSTIQCVVTADQAHTARAQGNRRGIHHELCTRAGSANWQDAYHQAMLRRAAAQAARDAHKWNIPIRKLTSAQVADGEKGFCGHVNITNAFPADGGTHTDPGSNFPWTQFLGMVRDAMNGDDEMALSAEDKEFLSNLLAPTTKAMRAGFSGDTQIREAVKLLDRDGVREFLWDVVHALRAREVDADGNVVRDENGRVSFVAGRDRAYDEADDTGKGRMRNSHDLLVEILNAMVLERLPLPPAVD